LRHSSPRKISGPAPVRKAVDRAPTRRVRAGRAYGSPSRRATLGPPVTRGV
jgi:hypothetical protein